MKHKLYKFIDYAGKTINLQQCTNQELQFKSKYLITYLNRLKA